MGKFVIKNFKFRYEVKYIVLLFNFVSLYPIAIK